RQAPPGRGLDDALGLAERCDAIVASEEERASCSALIAAAVRAGAVVAITNGPRPATILRPDGRTVRLPVTAVDSPREDLGADDRRRVNSGHLGAGGVLADRPGERVDEHRSGLEPASGEANGKRALPSVGSGTQARHSNHRAYLRAELPGAPLEELARDRVA